MGSQGTISPSWGREGMKPGRDRFREVARVESALGCRSSGEEMAAWMLQQDEPSWGTLVSLPWKYSTRKGSAPSLAPQPYF